MCAKSAAINMNMCTIPTEFRGIEWGCHTVCCFHRCRP